ncbi:MAG: hypothetical protein WA435_08160 [Gallionellaceae bacterium]
MRIKETIKKSGYFWLPSAPERRIPGTLSITDGCDIELEVVGLRAMFEIKSVKAMLQLIRQAVQKYMAFLPSTLRLDYKDGE